MISPFRLPAILAASVCTAFLMAPALANPMDQGSHASSGSLSITGHGESRVSPDQMLITLGVSTQADTAAEAMSSNATSQQAVLDVLKNAGLSETDIQTSGLTLNPVMNYPGNGVPPTLEGYSAQNLLTVRVRDMAQSGAILDSVVSAGANEMRSIQFVRADSRATEDKALKLAVSDAIHRAGIMAEAAGVELGPILHIGEPSQIMSPPEPRAMRVMDAGSMSKSVPVEGGEIAFTSDVQVIFSLGEPIASSPSAEDDTATVH
ncbi:MAG: SIMPL domain-containing protein [Paracoccus sp. (in: a-proteobacteria)]